ncbi:hypothetical protein SCALM49S_06508 [Streptomyces californicus]
MGAGGEVADEALDGAADADQGQRFTGLVLDQVQIGVLPADLEEDRVGEFRRLGPGDLLEAVEVGAGDVLPGRAGHGAAGEVS